MSWTSNPCDSALFRSLRCCGSGGGPLSTSSYLHQPLIHASKKLRWPSCFSRNRKSKLSLALLSVSTSWRKSACVVSARRSSFWFIKCRTFSIWKWKWEKRICSRQPQSYQDCKRWTHISIVVYLRQRTKDVRCGTETQTYLNDFTYTNREKNWITKREPLNYTNECELSLRLELRNIPCKLPTYPNCL